MNKQENTTSTKAKNRDILKEMLLAAADMMCCNADLLMDCAEKDELSTMKDELAIIHSTSRDFSQSLMSLQGRHPQKAKAIQNAITFAASGLGSGSHQVSMLPAYAQTFHSDSLAQILREKLRQIPSDARSETVDTPPSEAELFHTVDDHHQIQVLPCTEERL